MFESHLWIWMLNLFIYWKSFKYLLWELDLKECKSLFFLNWTFPLGGGIDPKVDILILSFFNPSLKSVLSDFRSFWGPFRNAIIMFIIYLELNLASILNMNINSFILFKKERWCIILARTLINFPNPISFAAPLLVWLLILKDSPYLKSE